jgi:hypothetical protein
MKSKVIAVSIIFAFSSVLFIAISGSASAAKWPGNQWADNSEIQIVLSRNEAHKDISGTRTQFALYARTPGTKTITINGYNNGNPKCGERGIASVFQPGNLGSVRQFAKNNCTAKTTILANPDNTVQYQKWDNPNESYTYYVYILEAKLDGSEEWHPQNNDAKFAFTVDSNDGDFYQLKGDEGKIGLPIASNRGNVYLNNIRIPVGSCQASGGQRFVIYDSDNAADYWAQTKYPDYAGYKPVKFFLNYQIGFASSKLAKDSSSRLDWKKVDGDAVYYPDDTAYAPLARPPGSITWDIDRLNNNNKAFFVIKDLGGDNFLNFYIPYNGADAGIGCPPERGSEPTDEWRLNPSVNIINGSENGVYLSGAHSVRFFYNNGLNGVPGTLGAGDGEGTINNGNSYVDVNASLTLNGTEKASTTRFYVLDQRNRDPENKTLNYVVGDLPGKYCATIQIPYGEIGRKKTVEAAQNPDYDLIRRYRTFYSGSSIVEYHSSTYRKYMLNDNDRSKLENQWIRWGFEGPGKPANPAYYESDYKNWPNGFPQDRFWSFYGHLNAAGSISGSTPEKCIYIYNATPNNLSDIPYEKGSGAGISASISIDTGGATPPPTNVGWHLYITGSGLNISKPVTANTNGTNLSINNVFTATEQAVINNLAPGTKLDYRVVVDANGEEKTGKITINEVPFARFYGNDVYSTNGQIKFNDSSNDNSKYEERGSVAQYAAFASGANNFLDTAAFRYKQTVKLNPQPPTGLMSAISYLTQNSVTTYNDVAKNLPENCLTTINPAAIPQSGSSVCYDLGSSNVTLNSLNYSNKITIKTTGNIYINGNITNATTAANKQNPANTGVLLLSANNIFIDKGVTRADAILVASESINTCYNGASKILNSQLDELCRSKLVINGSVSANNISFSRVGGSRLLAPLGAGANNDLGAGIEEKNGEASQTLTSGLSAEIINFPAYLYWAKPYLQDKSASGGTVESMFVAPPRK